MLKIRSVWKATEIKRFKGLEKKYHYMGETHSGISPGRRPSAEQMH